MRKTFFALLALTMTATTLPSAVQAEEKAATTADKTIVEVAVGNKDFTTLVAVVKAAGLVETLSGKGPFTVLAPTNAAFAKLPKATIAELLTPAGKDTLIKILTYHVIAGNVLAETVVTLDEAKTVQGSMVKIKVVDGAVLINKSKVTATDIKCKNGVIHVIDTVLMPK